jgi:hypothetical protein
MSIGSGNAFDNWEGKITEGMTLHTQVRVDTSYINVMGLTLVDGDGFTALSTTERQYILNETAVKTMGMTDPVGKWVDKQEWNIIKFLVNDFMILVGISILIAMPLAYYWLNTMLQDYVYRISLSWWMFAVAALITGALTVLTVGRMAFKAATKNPVDAIKSE